MSCKKPWDRMFLSNNFPRNWIHRNYKNHREELHLERHDNDNLNGVKLNTEYK